MAGTFDSSNLPKRPGLYINFVSAAQAKLAGGINGTVALALKTYTGGTATADKVYEVESEVQAETLFGAANIESIKLIFEAGAKKVLVYTLEAPIVGTLTEEETYDKARFQFEGRPFDVIVLDEFNTVQHAKTVEWAEKNRGEGKHFFVVLGGDATTDLDPAQGDARTTLHSDDYVINLTVGVEKDGVDLTSSKFAPFIAGIIANVGLTKSLTFLELPVQEVSVRMTKTQVDAALTAGSLIFVNDGEKVKVVQGLVSTAKKIRSIKIRQTIAKDIAKLGEDNYIGKITNTVDGQKALVSAVSAYLEELQKNGVIKEILAELDKGQDNSGDTIHLSVGYKEVDSVEKILLSITI